MQHVKPLTAVEREIIKVVRELIIYHPSLCREAGDWFYTDCAMDEIERRNHLGDEEWIANEHLNASIPGHRLMACIKAFHDDPSDFCTMRRSNAERVAARIVYVAWLVSDPNASVVAPGFGDIELAPWDESGQTLACRWWASMGTRTTYGYGFAVEAIKVIRAKAGYGGKTKLDTLIAEAEKQEKETAEHDRLCKLNAERQKAENYVEAKQDDRMFGGGSDPDDAIPDELVTLDQAAAMVGMKKRTLERYLAKEDLPDPCLPGGGGKPNRWYWKKIRPALIEHFRPDLPEIFPASRFTG